MLNKKLTLALFVYSIASQGAGTPQPVTKGFYVGGLGGYGSTTWGGLVPEKKNQNMALSMSTPIKVSEGGGVWGVFGGYEFNPYFALEAGYTHFPQARITFDEMSLFSFKYDDLRVFSTATETIQFMGKIMMFIPDTNIRIFSSFGAAKVHREDMLTNQWHLGPTFGVGLNYHFTPHLMGEIGGNYTAGFGESQLNPSDSYIPFLYSTTLRLAYVF